MRTRPRRLPCCGSWTSRARAGAEPSGTSPERGTPDAGARDLGDAVLDGTARGSFASGFDTLVAAHLGGTALSYKGRARVERGQGHVEISSADLRPTLMELGLLPPPTSTGTEQNRRH